MSSYKHDRSAERLAVALYSACKHYDLFNVREYLPSMKIKEINYQMPSDGNTALHEATRHGHFQIIKLLLEFYAARSLRNYHGQRPYDLALTDGVRQLFKRPETHFRFISCRDSSISTLPVERDVKCKSLVNDQSFYEWELIDPHASQKALRFRGELQPSTTKGLLKNRIYSIEKGYLKTRLSHLPSVECIRYWFKRAGKEDNPFHILKAYTTCQNFSKILNSDMARNVIHDLTNGCSKFCCECLYLTEDGTKSIAIILLYHPQFQSLNFVGQVYRGLVISETSFSHYTEGCCIITTTFLSTSKNRTVAEWFSGQDNPLPQADDISCLCIYTIKNENRTALYIADYSEFQEEEEVLILPYSPFRITKILRDDQQRRTEIHLEECDAAVLLAEAANYEKQHKQSYFKPFSYIKMH